MLERPSEYIRDYTIHQEFMKGFEQVDLHITFEMVGNPAVLCTLRTKEGTLIGQHAQWSGFQ